METDKIIHQLRNGNEERAFVKLYRLYPQIERHILVNSGSKNEAEDIFQEALIVLFNKVQTLKENPAINIEGFLVNTAKLLWNNEIRKKKVRQHSGDEKLATLEYEDDILACIEKEKKFREIELIIQKLGKKCREILEMFYFRNFSMDKIAKAFGYKAVQSAKAKKYKCMEHARKMALARTSGNNSVNLKNQNP